MANKISINNSDLPEDIKQEPLRVAFDESSLKKAKENIKQHKRRITLIISSLVLFLFTSIGLIFFIIKKIKMSLPILIGCFCLFVLALFLEILYLKKEKYI
jgi:hypothetical protein